MDEELTRLESPEAESPPVKPGWQTSEWLTTHIGQMVSLAGLLVVLSGGSKADGDRVQSWVGNATAAVGIVLANAWLVVQYVKSRTAQKLQAKANGRYPPPTWTMAILVLLALAGPAPAQFGLININRHMGPQTAPSQPDPNVIAHLSEIKAQNAEMLGHLRALRNQQPQVVPVPQPYPVPQPPPSVIIQYGQPPLQTLPLQGAPLQAFPLQGPLLQQLPIQGSPLQQLPIQGQPLQPLPLQGAPLQQFGPAVPVPGPAPGVPAQPGLPLQLFPVTPRVQGELGPQRFTKSVKALYPVR